MKIGLLTDNYPFPPGGPSAPLGGIGRYTQVVAEQLVRMGHETHVFTSASVRMHRPLDHRGVHIWQSPQWARRRDMAIWQALEFTMHHRNDALKLNQYSLACAVRKAAKRKPFDVIESPDLGALGAIVARSRNALRFAVRLHCPSGIQPGGTGQLSRMNKRERTLAEQANVVTCPTEAARQEISRFWNRPLDNVRVIPNPICVPRVDENPVTRKQGGIYFGRLEYRKGIDTLASALARICADHPDFSVTFVGPDCTLPSEEQATNVIARLAAPCRASRHFRCIGPLQHDSLKARVQAAMICLIPSRRETFGLAFAEAMSWGMACVVSDIPPFRELAEEGTHCLFHEVGNSDHLADRVLELLEDRSLVSRLSSNAAAHARRWSTDRIVPQLIDAWLR